MTSPLTGLVSSSQRNEDYKRKREDLINYDIEELLHSLIDSIHNDKTVKVKRQKK
jgi:hypothetical protein